MKSLKSLLKKFIASFMVLAGATTGISAQKTAAFERGSLNAIAITDFLFMTSRDGYHWKRYDEAIWRPGPEEPNNWWCYTGGFATVGMIEMPGNFPGTDNEISMFIAANRSKAIPVELYRYTMRVDGFVSYNATYKPQILTTSQTIDRPIELTFSEKVNSADILYYNGDTTQNIFRRNGRTGGISAGRIWLAPGQMELIKIN